MLGEVRAYEKGLDLALKIREARRVVIEETIFDCAIVKRKKREVVIKLCSPCNRRLNEIAYSLATSRCRLERLLIKAVEGALTTSVGIVLSVALLILGGKATESPSYLLALAALAALSILVLIMLVKALWGGHEEGVAPLPPELISVVEALVRAHCSKCADVPSEYKCYREDSATVLLKVVR